VSRGTLDPAMSTCLSLTGLSPSLAGFPKTVLLNSLNQFRGPNPSMHARWFGLFRFRSPLLTESHVVFSSSGYLDVSVHRVPFLTLCIGVRKLDLIPREWDNVHTYIALYALVIVNLFLVCFLQTVS